jgi:hypothetical protein
MARRMGTATLCSPCYHLNQMLPVCKKKDIEMQINVIWNIQHLLEIKKKKEEPN